MSKTLQVIRVFLASPGDLSEERNLFPSIIGQFNEFKADAMDVELRAFGWEDTLPGWGRPQALINDEVRSSDIFIMLLWKRWGTPSGEFSSGTEEEFNIAYERYKKTSSPHLLLYFRSVPQAMMADPGEQLKKVLNFRASIEEERIGLFKTYDSTVQWRDLIMKHLGHWLDRKVYGTGFATETDAAVIQVPPEIEKRLIELQKEVEGKTAELRTTQSKLRTEAIRYAVEATRFIKEGSFTLAEENFSRSIELYEEPEVLHNFAVFWRRRGSLDRAKEMFERLLRVSDDSEYQLFRAVAYRGLASFYKTNGDLSNAESMFKKALEIDSSIDRKDGMASSYLSLGNVYTTMGDATRAEEMYEKAWHLNDLLGRKKGLAATFLNLANLAMSRGDLNKAKKMYEEALKLNTALGRRKGMANSYLGLGTVAIAKRDSANAQAMFRKALELFRHMGLKEGQATAYVNLGGVYSIRGDLSKAREMYERALKINTALGRKLGMANAYTNLGVLSRRRENMTEAKALWEKARFLFEQLDDHKQQNRVKSWIDLEHAEPISVEELHCQKPAVPPDETMDTSEYVGD